METKTRGLASDGSPPDLRGQLAALLGRTMPLDHFQRWFAEAEDGIESYGSDADLDLWGIVFNRLAEYPSGYIDAECLFNALAEDVRAVGETAPASVAAIASDRRLVTTR